ncbi:MAG: hypothetical protein ACRD3C_07800 [Vicinamibacterales bacterium]
MAVQGAVLRRTAWLFIRGESSVTMTVREDESGIALVLLGPETASATYRFTNMPALMAFAAAQEQRLADEGFKLQAVAERRGSSDRRRAARHGGPERRRSH